MKLLILFSFLITSCGDIAIKDNQVKDNQSGSPELESTDTVEAAYSYEYEYEYERIRINSTGGGVEPFHRTKESTCNTTPMASIIHADTWELQAIVDHSDNISVSLGNCTEVQCPTGFVSPRFDTLRTLIDWGIVDLGPEARYWWMVSDNSYIPSGSQYGSSNYEQYKTPKGSAYLICLKESAFEHLYVGE